MIAIVDDVELFQIGLGDVLRRAGHEVASIHPRDVLELVQAASSYDLALVSCDPPGVQEIIREVVLRCPIVAIAPREDAGAYRSLLRLGAICALSREDDLEHVVNVVTAALRGDSLLRRSVLFALASHVRDDQVAAVLSDNDRLLLDLLARGETIASVAKTLSRSERECYRLLSNLFARMQVSNRSEALVRAANWGLLVDR